MSFITLSDISCNGVCGFQLTICTFVGIAVETVFAFHYGEAIGCCHEMTELIAMHQQGDDGAIGLWYVNGFWIGRDCH